MKNEIISKIQYNTSNENKEIIMDDMGDEYDNLEIIEGNNIESLNENDTNNNEKEEENFLGPKKGFILKEIKNSIDSFIKNYNKIYFQSTCLKFKDSFKKIMDEKFKKIEEISANYNNQIKEIEFLLASNDEDYEKNIPLNKILDSLIEEQQHEIALAHEYYDKLINDTYTNYKNNDVKSKGSQLIEEKLKLEIFNHINDLLNPKSSKFVVNNN